MMYFKTLVDKIIILICALIVYLTQPQPDIIMVLVAVSFGGFLSYVDSKKLRAFLVAGFIVLCIYFPQLIFFLPIIAYDMFFYSYQAVGVAAIVPLVYFLQSQSLQTSLTVIALSGLAVLLRYRSNAYSKLYLEHISLNDAARELSMTLTKQNKTLIEKQDYELGLATLNERNRIAREIHDNVGHLLSRAILQIGALLSTNTGQAVSQSLRQLHETLSNAMNSIRDSVHQLHADSIDLNTQILELIDAFTFCEVKYIYQIDSPLDSKIKYAFMAVVQEALSNIMRHSNATQISLTIREHPAFYQLIIADNGSVKKIELNTVDGLGLKNMTQRINALNGNISFMTNPGFQIFISVPKEGYKA